MNPWTRPWSAEGLEELDRCPVCGSGARTLLHAALVDCTFRNAPGMWAMWKCSACSGGFLSPRPTPDHIHEAYLTYYTHAGTQRTDKPGLMSRLRARLSNGYMRQRFGLQRAPASSWGALAAVLLPGKRRALDHQCRHLPKPQPGARLMDVGCGSGEFLHIARDCGWDVFGLEPDPMAAAQAASHGVEVTTGGIEALAGRSDEFDAITLSHVIEHVHDPVELLRSCHRLLRPGGVLWLETPNIDSVGHRLFGAYWRGLEAPRHLAIFSRCSLQLALNRAGFSSVVELASPNPVKWMAQRSWAMAQGLNADTPVVLPWRLRLSVAFQPWLGHLAAERSQAEFLTCLARKASP